jgi:Uncharacterised nucleotidyltransferase
MFELMNFAAKRSSGKSGQVNSALQWGEIDDRHIQCVMDAGLGALLYHATQGTIEQAPSRWRDALHGADLTARVRHGNLCDAMSELLDACRENGVPVTLLKGISIADQHYPAPHLRPMGDIDILVKEKDCGWVESMMLRRGYASKAGYHDDQDEPHRAPLFHREKDVWVEIHTALFHRREPLLRNRLFSPTQIASQEVASTFQGRPALRLSRELQLAYVSSYWIRDFSRNPFHPSLVTPLIDAIYLLKGSGQPPDWDGLLGWLDNEMAAASLYITLSYIAARGLDPTLSHVIARLASSQRIIGAMELRIIMRMIDVNLVGGRPFMGGFGERHPMILHSVLNTLLAPGSHVGKLASLPWNIVFPPEIADRYTLRYQYQRLKRFHR